MSRFGICSLIYHLKSESNLDFYFIFFPLEGFEFMHSLTHTHGDIHDLSQLSCGRGPILIILALCSFFPFSFLLQDL